MISYHAKILIGIVVSLSLLFSAGLTAAQEEEFDEHEKQPSVYWHVSIDAQGKASTNLMLTATKAGPSEKDAREELMAGLREALQCTPGNVRFNTQGYGFVVNADCSIPVVKDALITKVVLKPSALQSHLKKLGSYRIDLFLSVPKHGYSNASREVSKTGYGSTKAYSLSIKPEEKAVPDVVLEFGYNKSYVIALPAVISFVLIMPIVLILLVRRRSLMLVKQDSTAAWFGYWRVHRWIAEGIWLVWLIMFWVFDVETFIECLSGSNQPILNALLLIIPPGIVSFLCQYLARPLWLHVRGIAWNRREMLVKGFWEHAATTLPIFFMIIGINSVFQHTGQAMLWFAAALITKLFGAWMHGKISKIMPRTLFGGELSEKILEMAQRAGIKIQQIFLMPSQHLQMGNAFAMQGRRVMITDYLLDRLTKQETDCVMAHEIGHVKKHHTLLLSWVGFFAIFLIISMVLRSLFYIIPSFLPVLMLSQPQRLFEFQGWFTDYLLYPLSLLFAVLIRYFLSRRCERSADEFAVLLTNDPENMITSLVKLSKMNLLPIQWGRWDEGLSTHPSTIRRVKYIAKNHQVPVHRWNVLLDTQPYRQEGLGYTVPDEATNTNLVFSVERKTRTALVNSVAALAAVALIPLLLGNSFSIAGLPVWVYATGTVIVPFLYIMIASFTSVLGYPSMKRELAAKLEQRGTTENLLQEQFVGLVPEEYPRRYDNHTVWDIGFLRINKDGLVYFGDKGSFCLPRERIISVEQGSSYPGWLTTPETYIRWTAGEKEGVLHLHSLEGNSIFELARQSKILLSRLMEWKQGSIAGNHMSPGDTALSLPTFSDVKGLHPNTSASLQGVLTAWMMLAFLVFGFSALLGLDNTLSWYGFGMASWCLFFSNLPVWRYSDRRKQGKLMTGACPASPVFVDGVKGHTGS